MHSNKQNNNNKKCKSYINYSYRIEFYHIEFSSSLKVLKFDDFWGFSSVAKLKGNETPGKNSHGLLCEG